MTEEEQLFGKNLEEIKQMTIKERENLLKQKQKELLKLMNTHVQEAGLTKILPKEEITMTSANILSQGFFELVSEDKETAAALAQQFGQHAPQQIMLSEEEKQEAIQISGLNHLIEENKEQSDKE